MIPQLTSPYQFFALNADFIADRMFNTKSAGIATNMTRSNWFKDNSMALGFVHKSEPDSDGSAITLKATRATEVPIKTETFSKKDIISDLDFFDKKVKSLGLDNSKKYIYSITEKTKDNVKTNAGVYELNIWETKTSAKINDAIDVFTNDFAFNEQSFKNLHGMYLFSQSHLFTLNDSKFGLKGLVSTSQKGTYDDRAANDDLVDWTGYAPKVKLTKEQEEKLKDLTVMAKMVVDNKTNEQQVQLTIRDKQNITRTIYFSTEKVAEYDATANYDINKFTEVWKNKIQFKPVYDLVNKLKNNIGQLSSLGMNGMLDHFIRITSRLNLLASSYKFTNTSAFIKEFGDYLDKKSDFNVGAMIEGMENVRFAEFNDISTLGSKGYIGLYWVRRIYEEFENFIRDNVTKHPEWVQTKIDSNAALNQILINEANKEKLVEEDKKFLDNHNPKIDYSTLSLDDVIALADKTRTADYAVLVNTIAADVQKFKANLDGVSDVIKGTGRNPWSDRTILFAKFIDEHSSVLFGKDWKFPGLSKITTDISINKFDSNYEKAASDKYFGEVVYKANPGTQLNLTGFVNDAVKVSLDPADFAKLKSAVLNPLGIVA